MGIVECYGWQNVSNLFSLQFCIEFSLYLLLSSIYALRSRIHFLSSTQSSTSYFLRQHPSSLIDPLMLGGEGMGVGVKLTILESC